MLLLSTSMLVVVGMTIGLLCHAAFEQQRERLNYIAQDHASLIENFIESKKTQEPLSQESLLQYIRSLHNVVSGGGKTGELVLASKTKKYIHYSVINRSAQTGSPERIAITKQLAQPMQRALSQRTGSMIGLDYKGTVVLAAYATVKSLNWGVVAKIDVAEVRRPFIEAGIFALICAFVMVAFGAILFFRFSIPLIARLESGERRMRAIVETAVDGILTISPDGTIETFNRSAERMFGYHLEEVKGQNVTLLMPEKYRSKYCKNVKDCFVDGRNKFGSNCQELVGRHKDGRTFPLTIAISGMSEDTRDKQFFTGILRDISAQKQAEERIRYFAQHDILTELPNRLLFHEYANKMLALAKRQDYYVSVFFLDLDGFKKINDEYGHSVGDKVLQCVAKNISGQFRAEDLVARFGGDEFVMLLEQTQHRTEAAAVAVAVTVAEKVIKALSEPIEVNQLSLQIGASIGISLYPQDADNMSDLLRLSDKAMYQAKSDGRNTYCFHQSSRITSLRSAS